jgi:hypothetical protein
MRKLPGMRIIKSHLDSPSIDEYYLLYCTLLKTLILGYFFLLIKEKRAGKPSLPSPFMYRYSFANLPAADHLYIGN